MSSASSDSRFPDENQRLIAQNFDQIINSDSYKLAHHDLDLLNSSSMRGVRMLMEISKPELRLEEAGITSTIIVLGGARIQERSAAESSLAESLNALDADPDSVSLQRRVQQARGLVDLSCYYDAAREFAFLVSSHGQQKDKPLNSDSSPVIVTGGGPGIMEAGNRGAFEAGCRSIGLNIDLPHEPPNPYITPNLCFKFSYLSLRKIHFVMRSVGAILFPGGFGTLDELFEILTLRQVGVKSAMPIILFGREYWSKVIDFEFMANSGLIDDEDCRLFQYADTALEAWELIRKQS
ncbi:putative lysine decarboxylase [Synechococcus sp. MIT S9509]|uniref:LOG family protein n=1 Tax=unclassified Synechococcus TaxID=2626047 RepID=UPI0007BBEC56|nr:MULTISPECIES: LOG family protein [unclassified Synechococcus]KZR85374.1 putative lysine decarboxylase [Synechococcus sp. MIT S9504]KZR91524.1 putative lysine decarboxylase [Synechococcus sp. MIT S9509]